MLPAWAFVAIGSKSKSHATCLCVEHSNEAQPARGKRIAVWKSAEHDVMSTPVCSTLQHRDDSSMPILFNTESARLDSFVNYNLV